MKKRWICLFLALLFLLSACGKAAAPVEEEQRETRRRARPQTQTGETAPTPDTAPDPTEEPAPAPTPAPTPEPTPEPTPAPTPEPTPAPPQEPVYTAYHWEGDYADDVGNSYHYTYLIPAFNGTSADALTMNNSVYYFVYSQISDDLDNIQNGKGFSLYCQIAGYSYFVNGSLVSVLTQVSNDWGQDFYLAQNYDVNKQCEVRRAELLAMAGLDEESFLPIARAAAAREFGDYSKYPSEMLQFAEDQYHKTVMDENLQDTQLFVNGNGHLCMVVRIFSMAGADWYWHVVEL